jgi:cell shape-determining protein MreC
MKEIVEKGSARRTPPETPLAQRMLAEDYWNAHVAYLEEEVRKIGERVGKLEAIIPDLDNEQKKHALRELLRQLREEASEHRKYLALVKRK